jgi:hypothetical protein
MAGAPLLGVPHAGEWGSIAIAKQRAGRVGVVPNAGKTMEGRPRAARTTDVAGHLRYPTSPSRLEPMSWDEAWDRTRRHELLPAIGRRKQARMGAGARH